MKPEFTWLSPSVCTLIQDKQHAVFYQRLAGQALQLRRDSIENQLAQLPNHSRLHARIRDLLTRAANLYCAQLIQVGAALPLLLRVTRSVAWELEVFQLDQEGVRRIGYLGAMPQRTPPLGGGPAEESLLMLDFQIDFFGGKKLGTYLLTLLQRLALHVGRVASITGELSAHDDIERLMHFYQRQGFHVDRKGEQIIVEKRLAPITPATNATPVAPAAPGTSFKWPPHAEKASTIKPA